MYQSAFAPHDYLMEYPGVIGGFVAIPKRLIEQMVAETGYSYATEE